MNNVTLNSFHRLLRNIYILKRRSNKRPFFYLAIVFITGICAGYYFKTQWLIVNSVLILVCLFCYLKENFLNQTLLNTLLFGVLVMLAGALLISWEEYKYESQWSVARYNDSEVRVIAEVKEDLSALEGNKIYLKPYYVDYQRIKYGLIELDRRYLSKELADGELVEIRLYLKEPSTAQNPGNFSYYHYLKKKRVYSQGYQLGTILKAGFLIHPLRHKIISLKKRLLNLIDQHIGRPSSQVVKALILGEREGLPIDWEKSFTESGVNHLLAISGLHVGFILMVLITLLKILKVPLLSKNLFTSMLLVLYIILTGIRPSVLRAGILAITYLWAPFFKRRSDLLNLLGFALIINLLLNPYTLFTPGFQLTYLVVFMLITWGKILSRKIPMVLAISIAAQFAAAPLTTYYFNSITPVGILTNIWAIPLVGFIVSFTIIVLMLGLFFPLFIAMTGRLIALSLFIVKKGTDLMTILPGGHLEMATPSPVLISTILIFLLILPYFLEDKLVPVNRISNQLNAKLTIITFIILMVLQVFIPIFIDNNLNVYFLSVGQGDSIYIKTPDNHHILIDGGGFAGQDYSQGEVRLLPFFKYKGIKKLDMVIVTHYDADHALGVRDVLINRDVSLLAIPTVKTDNELALNIMKQASVECVPVVVLKEGDLLQFGEVKFLVLNPSRKGYSLSSNNNSIVLKVVYRDFTMLLTGDLEKDGEYRLIKEGYDLRSSILKLGHHGSGGSSSSPFLREVCPLEAVVSVGRNKYGHPSEALLNRINQMGIRTWRTDKQGAIIIKTDGYRYSIWGYIDK